MRQIVFPAALGGCTLGGGATPVWAAEWSITPSYSASVDYDSNRLLQVDGKSSDASVLAIDLRFKRALEDIELTLEPRYALRRFTDPALGNGDDRTVNAGFNWVRERSTLNLTASYWDQSTLTTEPLETGIISADTHRLTKQAGASWTWNQTERRSAVAQLSDMDVSYQGRAAALFSGFRYPTGSLGERFSVSERGSCTLSAFGSLLSSSTAGNSSREVGLQTQVVYSFSERTNINASIGESTRVLSGRSSQGTDAALTLDHHLFLSKLSLGYSRSLVPYGTGFLVQQELFTASISRPLSPYLDSNVALLRSQANETAVLLRVARRSYDSLSAGLTWHPVETWSVGAQIAGIRSQPGGPGGQTTKGWHSSITVTWSPLPKSRSW